MDASLEAAGPPMVGDHTNAAILFSKFHAEIRICQGEDFGDDNIKDGDQDGEGGDHQDRHDGDGDGILTSLYNVQCTIYNVQCTVYKPIQCT